ncbi:ASCH domain-containing protein [Clostridium sp. FP1]|uniref:ASCH domain-containing protein n=1 Tax=Clostridium sp. FP1 TaxID=2724076 RepID=UPI0013E988E5|nr:ASCH domain-containing protein [Clostridium sp. FP1]MBZ9637590.1 ASCH domain-containing protein [Clostridium sp. FP1]
MKCLSIIEPFATLIAIQEKKIETRSWKTNYRGKIAIHASKNINKEGKESCLKHEFMKVLEDKYILINGNNKIQYNFNFGNIIAIGDLIACVQMKELYEDYAILENGMKVEGNELIFGDYTPGRYAWILDNIHLINKPLEVKGHLGLWNYNDMMI